MMQIWCGQKTDQFTRALYSISYSYNVRHMIDWLIEDTLQAQSTPVKDEVKFLGLIFDKLNFNSHVRILKKKKCQKALNYKSC